MTLVTLDLGSLDPPAYETGWYRDPSTGQYYYYNASTGQWYIYAAGYLYPLAIAEESAPYVVDIAPGDTLRVNYSYKYSGPALPEEQVEEYASIGVKGALVYDEKASKSQNRFLAESLTPIIYYGTLDIVLPANAQEDWNDIEVKVTASGVDGSKELGKRYIDALHIVTVVPVFSEFAIVDYAKV